MSARSSRESLYSAKHVIGVNIDRKNIDKFAHVADLDEIRKNDYNCNIPKYVDSFEKELFKPATGMPQHVVTIKCQATFIDIEDGNYIEYETMASGSDTCDKAVSGASALAFRNWFDKNFTPSHLVVDEFAGLNTEVTESHKL